MANASQVGSFNVTMLRNSVREVGAHIRVIAPSRSLSIIAQPQVARAHHRLERLGFQVSFGRWTTRVDKIDEADLSYRLDDFERAIDDPEVDLIMSAIGGYSSSELLPYIDYKRVALAGKTFVGFSDVGVLLNNITFRSNIVTICGPHFSSFGNTKAIDYTETCFLNALRSPDPYEVPVADTWGDESWPSNALWRLYPNLGPRVVIAGDATGIAIGGNVASLVGNMPKNISHDSLIVFLEVHDSHEFRDFVRWSRAILGDLPQGFVSAILCGKFPMHWEFGDAESTYLEASFRRYTDGPIVLGLDFGHNVPFFSYPLGGTVNVIGGEAVTKVTLLP